jgi:hypothetical protein
MSLLKSIMSPFLIFFLGKCIDFCYILLLPKIGICPAFWPKTDDQPIQASWQLSDLGYADLQQHSNLDPIFWPRFCWQIYYLHCVSKNGSYNDNCSYRGSNHASKHAQIQEVDHLAHNK